MLKDVADVDGAAADVDGAAADGADADVDGADGADADVDGADVDGADVDVDDANVRLVFFRLNASAYPFSAFSSTYARHLTAVGKYRRSQTAFI
ncbi:hypothetical protein [Absidia glauca]|uniref:Uncharacterized protein n=1 Tax=Absidia glauca TaxID=4829 RepID=A0A163IR83_ABSGL|nr:hypothetical protein [Absidia glauca]